MRLTCGILIAAVALISCGGGASIAPVASQPHATLVTTPTGGVWNGSIGPWASRSSGKLNAIAVDPRDPRTILVGGGIGADDAIATQAGIFRTTDGGATWSAANAGLEDTTINALVADRSGAFYAATERGGIYRSSDGGRQWTRASGTLAARTLVRSGDVLYAASGDGLLVSNDGMVWTVRAHTASPLNALAVAGGDVYVGSVDGTVSRVALDGSVRALHQFPALGSVPPTVHQLAVDPQNALALYASVSGIVDGTYSDALYRSLDGGATWMRVTLPAGMRGAQAMAFSTTVPHRLFVAGLTLGATDDGATFATAGGYGDARTLTVLDGDALLLASDQGVARGTFSGGFAPITAGLPINIVRSVARAGSTIVVTMQDFAPAASFDGGVTWQTLATNSSENGTAAIDPAHPNVCYVFDRGIDVSTDGCRTFANQAIGDRVDSTEPLAFDANGAAYALTTKGVAIARDGTHFQPSGWNVPEPVDIAVDPSDAKNIYVSSVSGGLAVWRSRDGGASFVRGATLVAPGLSYPGDAASLAVDPVDSNVVVAATQTALYRSNDGGATFAALHQLQTFAHRSEVLGRMRPRDADAGAQAGESSGYNIDEHVAFAMRGSATRLIVTSGGGIAVSDDLGTTLVPAAHDAISQIFEGFTLSDGRICSGTDGQGVLCADPFAL